MKLNQKMKSLPKRKLNYFNIIIFIWLILLTIISLCGIIDIGKINKLETIPEYNLNNYTLEELEVL